MTTEQRISICHRCPHLDIRGSGTRHPPCNKSGRHFVEHCQSGICPMGRFHADPADRKTWPLAARALACFAVESDAGLGDTFARFTGATGIDRVVHRLAKILHRDCGCQGRREQWNVWYPLK